MRLVVIAALAATCACACGSTPPEPRATSTQPGPAQRVAGQGYMRHFDATGVEVGLPQPAALEESTAE